jgi:biopolymer transport protein TolR
MGASLKTGGGGSRRRKSRHRHTVMSEINVTPMVDVMLVLLIIFMVTAPLLTSGVEIDLPSGAKGASLSPRNDPPLELRIDAKGLVYIQEQKTPVERSQLVATLTQIVANKGGKDTYIAVHTDKNANYETFFSIYAELIQSGFKKAALVSKGDGAGPN